MLFFFLETGFSTEPCSDIYVGKSPFSEPETESLSKYLLKQNPIAYISLHSFSQMWLLPFGYSKNAKPKNHKEMVC